MSTRTARFFVGVVCAGVSGCGSARPMPESSSSYEPAKDGSIAFSTSDLGDLRCEPDGVLNERLNVGVFDGRSVSAMCSHEDDVYCLTLSSDAFGVRRIRKACGAVTRWPKANALAWFGTDVNSCTEAEPCVRRCNGSVVERTPFNQGVPQCGIQPYSSNDFAAKPSNNR